MNGAEAILRTARAAGVEACFANPGTTEMALVRALDGAPGIRAVLGLFEGVCTGAADGWARMRGAPALALLHLGPGLANGLANLHNARRARSPVVCLVGDHATWHRSADAPLASDIEALARTVSTWVRTAASPEHLARDAAEAMAAARSAPGGVATLVVPSDLAADPAPGPAEPVAPAPPVRVAVDRVERAARTLREGPSALLLGGPGLGERGQRAAARTGCRLLAEGFPARMERGAGLPWVERMPYFPDRAVALLAGLRGLVLAGAREPVAFFGFPGMPSRYTPAGCALEPLAAPGEDVEAALEDLADALDAPAGETPPPRAAPAMPEGPLTPETIGAALALLQPEGAIVVDEAATSGVRYFHPAASSPRHTLLTLTGGSIGMGPPCATGAALACPDRVVFDFQGDGGALYTPQALWTQAREQLHVVTLVCSNRRYRILQLDWERPGSLAPGPKARSLTELSPPPVDWVQLARGLGVPGTRVESVAELRRAMGRALGAPGPHLLELEVAS